MYILKLNITSHFRRVFSLVDDTREVYTVVVLTVIKFKKRLNKAWSTTIFYKASKVDHWIKIFVFSLKDFSV